MLSVRFLIGGVKLSIVDNISDIHTPTYADSYIRLNEDTFTIHIPNIAFIQASRGKYVHIKPLNQAESSIIQLYLDGSVLAAILMQRRILSFHGSSVIKDSKGILICGESGAGKSTITYGLSQQHGVDFLTDDITPIVIQSNIPTILAIGERLKVWEDTLSLFNIDSKQLTQVRPDVNKFFIEVENNHSSVDLDTVIILKPTSGNTIHLRSIHGTERLKLLLGQVYRNEFLAGMPSTELAFFKTHAKIAEQANFYILERPLNSQPEQVIERINSVI